MAEDDEKKAKNSWIYEHEDIQMELLRMKEQLLKEGVSLSEDDGKDLHISKEGAPSSSPAETGSLIRDEGPPEVKKKTEREIPEEWTDAREEKGAEIAAPKMDQGKIPASPDLSSKIANVLALENKLKRRKFELEKREKRSGSEGRTRQRTPDGEARGSPGSETIPPAPPVPPISGMEPRSSGRGVGNGLEIDTKPPRKPAPGKYPERKVIIAGSSSMEGAAPPVKLSKVVRRKRDVREDAPESAETREQPRERESDVLTPEETTWKDDGEAHVEKGYFGEVDENGSEGEVRKKGGAFSRLKRIFGRGSRNRD